MQMITRYSLIPLGNFRVPMKMLDNNINLEGLFTICLYTYVDEGKNGSEYFLLTNRYKKRPAKSPMEMFDDTLIPNDLKLISEKIDEYYS